MADEYPKVIKFDGIPSCFGWGSGTQYCRADSAEDEINIHLQRKKSEEIADNAIQEMLKYLSAGSQDHE